MPKSFANVLGRIALFIIYAWFGILKLIGKSPASELIKALHHKVIPGIPFHQFFIAFALFEVIIGILFLFPKFAKIAYALFAVHITMAILPLFLLPSFTWQSFLIPTIEGQYIIKNIALISVVVFLSSQRRY